MRSIGRRFFLRSGTALAGLTLVGWRPSARQQSTGLTPADFEGLGPCTLTPEQTEGPFYADLDMMRRDITESHPGHPLRLGIRVVDSRCEPVPGALVDVWHCDVEGDYSAYADGSGGDDAGPGTTFLRGTQRTDDEGIAEFRTIYPGWYTGRAVHIHMKVHVGDKTVLTSQLYLPDDVTDRVHAQTPYAAHGVRDTRNNEDLIAGDPAANGTLLHTSAEGSGTLGLVVAGVTPRCNWFERWWSWLFGQSAQCG
jgi:protocatechuate 3,4-dioxygenase beta subunit